MEKDLLSIKNLNKEDIFSLIDRAIDSGAVNHDGTISPRLMHK